MRPEMTERLTLPDVLPALRAYMSHPDRLRFSAGPLESVLEDGNVSDDSIAYARDRAVESGDHETAQFARLMLRLSQTQRKKLAWLAVTMILEGPDAA